jgi:CRP-like cAMP-binding protein
MSIDIDAWRQVSWLPDLAEPERYALSSAVEETVSRGSTILHAHDTPRAVYIVREGGVKEVQGTPEGKEVILGLYGTGDLFGAFLGDSIPPSEQGARTSVAALISTKLLVVPRETWTTLLERHPELKTQAERQLVRRLHDAWRLVRMLSRYTTEARLKSALVLLAERWGQPREEGIEIALDLTHRTLADLAGASREKVTRALGILQQKGLVRVVQRRLVIPSLDRLHQE